MAVLLLLACLPAAARAQALTVADVACLDRAGLDALFQQGQVNGLPVGFGKGKIVLLCDGPGSARKARMQGMVWKGKVFECDGQMINQFAGFRALRTRAVIEASWLDGQPCIVLEYPPKTPLFGNARDEIRQIGPNLYLGRFYERCPCPRFRGYFVLTFGGCGCP